MPHRMATAEHADQMIDAAGVGSALLFSVLAAADPSASTQPSILIALVSLAVPVVHGLIRQWTRDREQRREEARLEREAKFRRHDLDNKLNEQSLIIQDLKEEIESNRNFLKAHREYMALQAQVILALTRGERPPVQPDRMIPPPMPPDFKE